MNVAQDMPSVPYACCLAELTLRAFVLLLFPGLDLAPAKEHCGQVLALGSMCFSLAWFEHHPFWLCHLPAGVSA